MYVMIIHGCNFCSIYVEKYEDIHRDFVKYQLYRKMIIPSFRALQFRICVIVATMIEQHMESIYT